MKRIITLFAVILMTASVFAQAPNKMSYQAVIRNSSNALVTNSAVGMRISILQTSATGTAVYVETQYTTTNANGLASLEIGAGIVVSGIFSTIDWANGPYFIKTETDPAGGSNYTITGTSQLLSVPYAMYAAASGSNIPGPAGPQGPAGATGPQGAIGLTGPAGPQGATGLTGPQGPAGTNGTNGNNGIDGKTVLNGTTNPTALIGNNGDFYINTTSNTLFGPKASGAWPTNGVSLVGPQGATGAQGPAGATGPAGPQGATGLLSSGATAGNTPYWNGTNWETNSSNIFNNGGNVGIGTTSPIDKLHVKGISAGNSLTLLRLQNSDESANTATKIVFINSTNGGGISNYIEAKRNLSNSSDLIMGQGITEFMRLNSLGNLGIGTTTPARTLHVNAVMRLEPIATAPASPAKGDMYFDSTLNKLRVYDGSSWQNCW